MAQHPLEPLSADEFRRTTEILHREGHVTETFRFASIELMEPAKQEVFSTGASDLFLNRSLAGPAFTRKHAMQLASRCALFPRSSSLCLTGIIARERRLPGQLDGATTRRRRRQLGDLDLAYRVQADLVFAAICGRQTLSLGTSTVIARGRWCA